jgi:hypothetical protein
MERGILGVQRPEDVRLEKLAEALAGQHLHQAAEHIGRHASFPGAAGLVHEWELAQLGHQL